MFAVSPFWDPEPDLWQALADPTRRAIIDRLAHAPQTTGSLCAGFPISRFGVMKHIGLLERAGLIVSRRQGRTRVNHLNAAPLQALYARWLSPRAAALAGGFLSLSDRSEENIMPEAEPQLSSVEVALDWDIAAAAQKVWRLLFDSAESWWPADYRAGPAGSVMAFDERAGGTLREERPDGGGLVWYNVIALDPLRSVDLSGNLASRYGGPATSLLHIELSPGRAEGSTLLRMTDSVFGRLGPGFKASAAGGWQAIIGEGLKPLAEAA